MTNFSLESSHNEIGLPVFYTSDNENDGYPILYHNHAALTFLKAIIVRDHGMSHKSFDTPRSFIGHPLLQMINPDSAEYLKLAVNTSNQLNDLQIGFHILGPYPQATMVYLALEHLSMRQGGQIYFSIHWPFYGSVVAEDSTFGQVDKNQATIIAPIANHPRQDVTFFTPNLARMLGYNTASEFLKKRKWIDLLSPFDRPWFREQSKESWLLGLPNSHLVSMLDRKGREILFVTNSTLISGRKKTLYIISRLENISHTYKLAEIKSEEGAIFALLCLMEQRSDETFEHTERVAQAAIKLSVLYGIEDEEELKRIKLGGKLHDLGKIGVPESIIRKPGPLTEEEWIIMKRHPEFGAQALSRLTGDTFKTISYIVSGHHLNWDGTGYPNNTAGEAIPLAARIVAIADAWDALVSERSYKAALSIPEALIQIQKMAGKRFDPYLVDLFVKGVEDGFIVK